MSEQANGVGVEMRPTPILFDHFPSAPCIDFNDADQRWRVQCGCGQGFLHREARRVMEDWAFHANEACQTLPQALRSPSPVGTEDIVEVLRFYADPTNWSVGGEFLPASADSEYRPDAGERARAALEAIQSIAPRTAVDAVAVEREACAKVVADMASKLREQAGARDPIADVNDEIEDAEWLDEIAAAIRARSNTEGAEG